VARFHKALRVYKKHYTVKVSNAEDGSEEWTFAGIAVAYKVKTWQQCMTAKAFIGKDCDLRAEIIKRSCSFPMKANISVEMVQGEEADAIVQEAKADNAPPSQQVLHARLAPPVMSPLMMRRSFPMKTKISVEMVHGEEADAIVQEAKADNAPPSQQLLHARLDPPLMSPLMMRRYPQQPGRGRAHP
jgi:(2Fe-2S) ferredoxin